MAPGGPKDRVTLDRVGEAGEIGASPGDTDARLANGAVNHMVHTACGFIDLRLGCRIDLQCATAEFLLRQDRALTLEQSNFLMEWGVRRELEPGRIGVQGSQQLAVSLAIAGHRCLLRLGRRRTALRRIRGRRTEGARLGGRGRLRGKVLGIGPRPEQGPQKPALRLGRGRRDDDQAVLFKREVIARFRFSRCWREA